MTLLNQTTLCFSKHLTKACNLIPGTHLMEKWFAQILFTYNLECIKKYNNLTDAKGTLV